MPRLAIPISGQMLYATGDLKLWADVTLSLRDGAGNFVDTDFRIDTGAEISTFPSHRAKKLGLFLPPRAAGVVHTQTGLEVRSAHLVFRIAGLGPTQFTVSCLFLGDPNTPPPPGTPRGQVPRNLLQPFALLNQLKLYSEKDMLSVGAPHGEFVLETV